ncbi:hypothetical protein V6N11_014988 [Hibiscus sabdariffa]|uniref:Uncharacterized protein n=1 Tax=Hibiscus sabdariffa TaxID=183260 RepID=A0ABR2TR96_9ROSI
MRKAKQNPIQKKSSYFSSKVQTINDYPFVVGQLGTRFSSDLDYFFDNSFWAILFWSFERRELFLIE